MNRMDLVEKIAEKTVKHPVLWIVFAAAGLVGTVVFANLFVDWLGTPDFFRTLYYAAVIIVFIVAFVILGSMGLCKGITWLIVKVRSGRAKSCGMFTARQLSGSASANSVMMGLLAVLMSLAIVGPNIFFSMSDIYTASVDETYLYDISGSFSTYEHDEGEIEDMRDTFTEQYTDIISEYVGIENYASFYIYQIYFEEQYVVSYYTQVKYSDFKNICKVLGYDLPADIGERFACRVPGSTAEPFEWNGDELLCPYNILLGYAADFTVVPDDEIQGTPVYGVLCVDVQDVKYDARALDAKVNWIDERHNRHRVLTIKEYERLDELGQGGLFLLGDLYASVVFLLLTLAILSLKMLTMVSEDKPKYAIMWKMGATKSQLFRSMLAQLLFFCCLPFVIPVYINVPLASAISLMYESSGYAMPLGKVIAQLSGFTLAALGVCVLYLIAVSIVAWYDIRRAFVENG